MQMAFGILTGLSLGVAGMASAAAADTLETVIVTGQPLATTARSSAPELVQPFVFDSVDAGRLALTGTLDLRDALRLVPAVAPVTGIGNFNTRFRLRGFVSTAQLRNGFRQGLSIAVTEPGLIERIEVLKGPSSALFGRFEPGGVVNILTRQPLDRTQLAASLVADEHGLWRGTVDANAPVGEQVTARLVAGYEHGESFRDVVDNRTLFAGPVVSFKLGEATRLTVEGEFIDRNGVFDRGFTSNALMLALPPERFLGEPGDRFDNRTTTGTVALDHSWGAWRGRLAGALGKSRSLGDYFFPVGAGAIPLLSPTGVLNRRNQTTDDVQIERSAVAELAGTTALAGIPTTVLLAAEWNEEVGTSIISRSTVNAPLAIANPVYGAPRQSVFAPLINTRATADQLAGLVQVEQQWTPWLRTTAALRLERLKAKLTNRLGAGSSQSASETALTPRLGVSVRPAETVSLFANWGRSFAPEVGTRPLVGNAEPEPSRGEQVEAGIKWRSADARVAASFALFHIEKTNIRVGEPAPSQFDRQVGVQRSQGFEVDLTVRPVDSLTVEAAYAFVDADVTRDRVLAGRTFQATPRHSASVFARWAVGETLGVHGSVTLVSRRFVDPANTFALDGYTRADVGFTWQPLPSVGVQANVLNVANARYFENGNTNNNLYPGQPRTLRLGLTVRP